MNADTSCSRIIRTHSSNVTLGPTGTILVRNLKAIEIYLLSRTVATGNLNAERNLEVTTSSYSIAAGRGNVCSGADVCCIVATSPHAPYNVTVTASFTSAVVSWLPGYDGGHPLHYVLWSVEHDVNRLTFLRLVSTIPLLSPYCRGRSAVVRSYFNRQTATTDF